MIVSVITDANKNKGQRRKAMTIFKDQKEAERIAQLNNQSDPKWTYVVRHIPGKHWGAYVIDAFDEENVFVGTL